MWWWDAKSDLETVEESSYRNFPVLELRRVLETVKCQGTQWYVSDTTGMNWCLAKWRLDHCYMVTEEDRPIMKSDNRIEWQESRALSSDSARIDQLRTASHRRVVMLSFINILYTNSMDTETWRVFTRAWKLWLSFAQTQLTGNRRSFCGWTLGREVRSRQVNGIEKEVTLMYRQNIHPFALPTRFILYWFNLQSSLPLIGATNYPITRWDQIH